MPEKCFYCPHPATTTDHVIPVSKGGSNKKQNKVPACKLCNTTKSNYSQEIFIEFLEFARSQYGKELYEFSRKGRRMLRRQFFIKTGIRMGFQ